MISYGVVAFRGTCSNLVLETEIKNLTADSDEVAQFISGLRAYGGGDQPEDILGALHTASELVSLDGFGFIVLVSDAPAHSYAPIDMRDEYPEGLGHKMDEVLSDLRNKNLELVYCPICPDVSSKFDAALEASYKDIMKKTSFSIESSNVVNLFEDENRPQQHFFVFCFDSSGSMRGAPWEELLRAF